MDKLVVSWDSRWREISGFPGYWINQYGQVFNMKSGKLISSWSNRRYGTYVNLRRNGKNLPRKVQRLYEIAWQV